MAVDGGAAPFWKRPVKLSTVHASGAFDCGKAPLNDWLKRYAMQGQAAGMANVYVTADSGGAILGYYALSSAAVDRADAPVRVTKGVGRYEIPVVLLARLAVDRSQQGGGLGRAILRDALLRTEVAADSIGVRALLIHCQDEDARTWYEQRGDFDRSPTDPLHLLLLMKDLRAVLRS